MNVPKGTKCTFRPKGHSCSSLPPSHVDSWTVLHVRHHPTVILPQCYFTCGASLAAHLPFWFFGNTSCDGKHGFWHDNGSQAIHLAYAELTSFQHFQAHPIQQQAWTPNSPPGQRSSKAEGLSTHDPRRAKWGGPRGGLWSSWYCNCHIRRCPWAVPRPPFPRRIRIPTARTATPQDFHIHIQFMSSYYSSSIQTQFQRCNFACYVLASSMTTIWGTIWESMSLLSRFKQ